MRLRKNLYQVRFSHRNSISLVLKTLSLAFPDINGDGLMVKLDDYTYMVYSSQDQKSVNLSIGIDMANDIDDFIVVSLNYEAAMSIFTDRLDIIEFIKKIKNDIYNEGVPTTQKDVDDILEKVSKNGIESLTREERGKLSRF